ncbi:MAG: iron-containing alcohol dehydrogenase [Acidimicrobiales bacterium]
MTGSFDLASLRRRIATAPDEQGLNPIGLEQALVGDGALEALPDVVARLAAAENRSGPVAIVSDRTPKRYRSGDLLEFVTKSVASVVGARGVFVGAGGHNAHADEQTLSTATKDCAGASCIVAVGSGTVADIGKVLAATHGLPYVIVQSANSVNGYADDRSVLLVNGVKRTLPSTWANVLIVDTDVLVDAPVEMNAAGLADLIAMFTAPADWYLANLLGMDDTYSPTVVALAREQGPALFEAACLVPKADRAALSQIAATLTLSGISMGIAGTTAPCSGMEHAVSHLLEMAAIRAGDEPSLHGFQVGVSSIVAALLWREVLQEIADDGLAHLVEPDAVASEKAVRSAFLAVDPGGDMAAECWRDYERKLSRWARAGERVELAARQWSSHERAIGHLLAGANSIVEALRSAGAPVSFSELASPIETEAVHWAVASCHLMRERFSVADLACLLGIWDEARVDRLVNEAAVLGSVS